METPLLEPRCAEFSFPRLNTLVRLEVSDESITIRATRDTFSPLRKDFFIRELAAEGFIPDQYRWSSAEEAGSSFGRVHWLVDRSWLRLNEAHIAKSRRTVFRLFSIAVLLLSLFLELGLPGLFGDSRAAMRSEKPVAAPMVKSPIAHLRAAKASAPAADPSAR